jgi:NDP-sugar pyrophosphorylase family protein
VPIKYPWDVLRATELFLSTVPKEGHRGEGVFVHPGATVSGPVILGERAAIGEGAVVEASVLWEDARIGESARVSGSIIAAGAQVGDAATVRDAVLADAAQVAAGHQLPEAARLMPGETAG